MFIVILKSGIFFIGSWKVKAVVKRVKTGCAWGSGEGGELLLSDNRIKVCWILKI
jgi:hypothetical protein